MLFKNLKVLHFILIGVFLGVGLVSVPARADDNVEAAFLDAVRVGTPGNGSVSLPSVLSRKDAEIYRQIFYLQKDGEWKSVDKLISKLDNKLLMGHVLAQRYLHPTKYRSRYKELKDWMEKYADLPDARRIYKLSLRRKPRNWRAPRRPVIVARKVSAKSTKSTGSAAERYKAKSKRLSRVQRRRVRQIKRTIRSYLRRGYTLAVKKLLRTREVKRLFSEFEYDQAKAQLGAGYFAAGRDEWALKWASEAAKRSGTMFTKADWISGLTAWRLGRYDVAARHFEAVANNDMSPWMISAAAFWAARAHLVNREPAKVNPLLERAAGYRHTFYGMLSRRILGLPNSFNWRLPRFKASAGEALNASPAGKRAIALVEVGQFRRAERELTALTRSADHDLTLDALALASNAAMPWLAMRLDNRLSPYGGGYDGAAYPLPGWAPKEGFSIDRALIYALVRQESQFNPNAKSRAGARGLMQLMPRTAGFVARDRGYRWGRKRRTLHTPEVNLSLGQKYIQILLGDDKIKGDMLLLAAAWNGGPGNLNKWRRTTRYMNDPLFFIESIPSRETRIFIERVFSNLWIYRNRLGQSPASLDAIAAGRWPVYKAMDNKSLEVAENGKNRRYKKISPR